MNAILTAMKKSEKWHRRKNRPSRPWLERKTEEARHRGDGNMVGSGATAYNTGRPVPLALHPNFAPLRCAKLRPCPGTLYAMFALNEIDSRRRKKKTKKNTREKNIKPNESGLNSTWHCLSLN
jgi:hypothetical protein